MVDVTTRNASEPQLSMQNSYRIDPVLNVKGKQSKRRVNHGAVRQPPKSVNIWHYSFQLAQLFLTLHPSPPYTCTETRRLTDAQQRTRGTGSSLQPSWTRRAAKTELIFVLQHQTSNAGAERMRGTAARCQIRHLLFGEVQSNECDTQYTVAP